MPNLGAPELLILLIMFGIPVLIVVAIVSLVRRPGQRQGPPLAGAAPGWLADPMKRHQFRYWDGAQWTAMVGDDGVQSTDPL